MTEMVELAEKFVGSLIGGAVGDAIGELAFRNPTRERLLKVVAQRETLTYTDDTAMAIGLAESLLEAGGVDQQHLGDTWRANYEREPWRGYASGPPTVFSAVEREDVGYAEAAKTLFGGEGSFGNGAAMRVAPLGLLFHDRDDLYERARLSAMVTHAHPVGVDGAAVQARAVAQAVALDPGEPFSPSSYLAGLLQAARTPEMEGKLTRVDEAISRDVRPLEVARELGRGVAVHESLPFAIYTFARHPDDFEACLLCAALSGGDRDTLAAMACAISGAYLGIEAVPRRWQEKLENREYIEGLALRLAEEQKGQAAPERRLRAD